MSGWRRVEGGFGFTEGVKLLRLTAALHTLKFLKTVLANQILKKPVRREALRELQAARPLDALRALHVYPVFEDEKSTGSDEKSVKQKIA